MRVIGVIDLKGGRAVHARGGPRDGYAPVEAAAGTAVGGDPLALAQAYVRQLAVRELYVADLDAIERAAWAFNGRDVLAMATLGVPLWVDGGVTTVAQAWRVLEAGASIVVVGLETLAELDALHAICSAIGGDRVALSIDVRGGELVAAPNVSRVAPTVASVARHGAEAGVAHVIVLDLARVGTGVGVDTALVADVRRAAPSVAVFAGGGVCDGADLRAARDAGCAGVLVATALLGGAIRGDEV